MASRQHLHKLDTSASALILCRASQRNIQGNVESCGLRRVLKPSTVSACTTADSRMVPLFDSP